MMVDISERARQAGGEHGLLVQKPVQAVRDTVATQRSAETLPIELSFATASYEQLEVRLDPSLKTLWYFMRPTQAPSYTPALLKDLSSLRGRIQQLFERPGDELPLLYLVNGSKQPNIFNLGGDLRYFAEHIRRRDRDGLRRYALDCVDLVYSSSQSLDLPIFLISLVQGDALGGGFEAALASDIIIAERKAKFGLPEILFNLFPGMGAYSFLSRRLDPTRATKMIMSGQIYTADDLFEMGLVDMVVEDGKGEEGVREYIARNSRKHAIQRTMRDVRRRVNPLTHQELIDVVDLWVDAAMALEDADLRKIDRLRGAQTKRIEASLA